MIGSSGNINPLECPVAVVFVKRLFVMDAGNEKPINVEECDPRNVTLEDNGK